MTNKIKSQMVVLSLEGKRALARFTLLHHSFVLQHRTYCNRQMQLEGLGSMKVSLLRSSLLPSAKKNIIL
jgi:hypothetical protein